VEAIAKESMEEAFEKIISEVPFVAEPRVADSVEVIRYETRFRLSPRD
jgi:hypothetical protein